MFASVQRVIVAAHLAAVGRFSVTAASANLATGGRAISENLELDKHHHRACLRLNYHIRGRRNCNTLGFTLHNFLGFFHQTLL